MFVEGPLERSWDTMCCPSTVMLLLFSTVDEGPSTAVSVLGFVHVQSVADCAESASRYAVHADPAPEPSEVAWSNVKITADPVALRTADRTLGGSLYVKDIRALTPPPWTLNQTSCLLLLELGTYAGRLTETLV
eukprot:CAMPEP_0169483508 /NCGR_PEP_ID=MMETSP1042-20121227/31253_1 /TAXON_ID=464988 /ORGANISM="Hemiselmis andersenii, Strain CCMP1180" /LENGTH=133 /DNA_ID=CAMNT_0009598461 /DNA_START=44 /DNA_END=445 /DNA_ORIENTATION=-